MKNKKLPLIIIRTKKDLIELKQYYNKSQEHIKTSFKQCIFQGKRKQQ